MVLLPCDHVSSSRLEKDPRTCKILSHQGINTIFYHTTTQNKLTINKIIIFHKHVYSVQASSLNQTCTAF